jgi:uncharacterized membrane protein
LKATTWRIGGLVMTLLVAWAVTGRADIAAAIGVADTCVKLVAFYVHERMWLRLKFGRIKPPDYQI